MQRSTLHEWTIFPLSCHKIVFHITRSTINSPIFQFRIKVKVFSVIAYPVALNEDIGNNTFEPVDEINDTLVEAHDNNFVTTIDD